MDRLPADNGSSGGATLSERDQGIDSILESLGDAVMILDNNLIVQRMNPMAEQMTGWSRQEAIGKGIDAVFRVVNGRSGESIANLAATALATGWPAELARNAILVSRSGTEIPIAAKATPVRGVDGWFGSLVLVFHDLARASWVREERIIATIAFETSAPQIVADASGKILRANKAALAMSGYSVDEFLKFNLARDLFTGQRDADLCELLNGASERTSWSGHTKRRAKTGILYHFWDLVTAVRDAAGDITHYVASMQDITRLIATSSALRESQDNYQRLIDSIADGVVLVHDGVIVDCNERYAQMMGYDKRAVIGQTVMALSVPLQFDGVVSSEALSDILDKFLREGEGSLDWSMIRADGSCVEFEVSLHRAAWRGQPALLAIARDVTRRREAERQLQELVIDLERKETAIRMASAIYGIVCWELDLKTGKVDWAGRAAELLGLGSAPAPEALTLIRRAIHREDLPAFDQALAVAIEKGIAFNMDYRVVNPGGEVVWINSQGEVEYDAAGNAVLMRGASGDITRRKLSEQEVERLAFYDPLTGLANRRLFLDRLQQACAHAVRYGHNGAVLFIDLDRFKLLNDSLGHVAGDLLLKGIAERLSAQIRKEDTLARLGGDEFVVLLPAAGADLHGAASHVRLVAEKLAEALREKFDLQGLDYHMSASIGAAIFPADGARAELVLDHADAAMYQAKKNGRNTIAFYQPGLQADADARLVLEQDLRYALERNELELYYQPQVGEGGKVISAEALLRWNHPSRGLVPPHEFIPVAEETGLIYAIGRWALTTACEALARWRGQYPDKPIGIAVNVSPLQFKHPDFLPSVAENMRRFAIAPRLLTLEITESILIENIDTAVGNLKELRALGVNISIDDFGTGYSSLYYLKNLPLDEIKIDKSYVRDILDDPDDAAIVKAIVDIAKHMGFTIVAEGVEHQAQARFLRGIGCNRHQGYLYSQPLPAAEFERFAWRLGEQLLRE